VKKADTRNAKLKVQYFYLNHIGFNFSTTFCFMLIHCNKKKCWTFILVFYNFNKIFSVFFVSDSLIVV